MMTQKLKIKYIDSELPRLCYVENKSDWIDLYTREDVFIQEGADGCIPLNVAIQLPKGYEAHIVPRSSTFKHTGLIQTNSMGIIDESYCGDNDEWAMPVYLPFGKGKQIKNGRKGTVICRGTRICQFRIMEHQPRIEFEEVETLGNDDRGGFGSTGR